MPRARSAAQAAASSHSASARSSAPRSARGVYSTNAKPVPSGSGRVDHRVGKPARPAHDRHRSVAQGVHLRQTARFEPRRHQEQVAPRVDPMRQRLVEPIHEDQALGVTRRRGRQRDPPARLACRQEHHPQPVAQQAVQQRQQDLRPFLLHQPSDEAGHRPVAVRQAEFGRERGATRLFPLGMGRVEPDRQVRIPRRIPRLQIGAIEDAGEIAAASAQHAVETAAQLLVGDDLARVGGADGVDEVGLDDAGLQDVEPAVELQRTGIDRVDGRQTDLREPLRRRVELVREVVDGEQGAGGADPLHPGPPAAVVERRQGRGGVVRVDHLGRPAEQPGQGERRLGVEGGPRDGVGKVGARRVGVHAGTAEQRRVLGEVDPDRGRTGTFQVPPRDPHLLPHPQRQRRQAQQRTDVQRRPIEVTVKRQHHPHLVPPRRQRRRQRGGHVGQPADLRHRRQFAGHHQYPHGSPRRADSARSRTVPPSPRAGTARPPPARPD